MNRPTIHYTPDRNWLNDPNGLVYYKGLFHLFYQYNPHGNFWGNMSWGHASSPDLATWAEHPVAITGDANEDIFSGSIVADLANTTGFGSLANPPLVAIYTSAFTKESMYAGLQAQSLAYSLDEGHTWTKHEGNPVLNRQSPDFRDPKVFRFTSTTESYWVMVAVEAKDQLVVLYRSPNLKDWTYLSSFGPANATGGVWECPDLFPLPVDGDPENIKWVLIVNLNPGSVAGGSGGQYFIGKFDGTTFVSENTVPEQSPGESEELRAFNWLDWGRDYYAAVSFSGVPDGRRIMIAWMNNWDYGNDIPTTPWRSSMTLPREVRLKTVRGIPSLVQDTVDQRHPAPSTVTYTSDTNKTIRGIELLPARAWGQVLQIDATLTPGPTEEIGLIVRGSKDVGTSISYNSISRCLVVNRERSGQVSFNPSFASIESAPVELIGGKIRLKILVDHYSVEVFAQNGTVTITDQIFPAPTDRSVSVYTKNGAGIVDSLIIHDLSSSRSEPNEDASASLEPQLVAP